MKLITEHTEDIQYITEKKKDGSSATFIEGIFMQAEKQNRNKRVYPKDVLKEAINKYVKEQVSTGRAVGELNHPDGPTINLDKVSHRITELSWEGNNVHGKAQVLNTPMGQIVSGLIEGGVKLGVSSRGMGSIEQKGGQSYVKNDFVLSTVDIVQDPSAQEAFVDGIMEGVEWVITTDGKYEQYVESTKKAIHKTSTNRLAEAQIEAWSNLLKMLKESE
jgi:hypothetical protein